MMFQYNNRVVFSVVDTSSDNLLDINKQIPYSLKYVTHSSLPPIARFNAISIFNILVGKQ